MINLGKRIFYNARIITITSILFAITIATAFSAYSYLPEAHADNTLKQIIEINGTYPAGVDSFNVTITPPLTSLEKSVAFLTFNHNQQNQHRDTFRSWNFTDLSTLTIYGNDQTPSANFQVGFHGTIFEFTADSDAFTQHLEFEIAPLAAEGEFEVAIPIPVNASTAFLVQAGNFHRDVDTTVGVEEFSRLRIINGTFYGILIGDTPNTGPMAFHNTIVDLNFTEVSVQRGTGTIGSGESVDTITPTAYDKTNSMMFVSHSTTGDFTQDPQDVAIKATINGADDIIIERISTSAANTVNYAWQLIEFGDGFIVAQHFNGSQATGTSVSLETIPTPVGNLSRSWAIGTSASPFGLGNGMSDSVTGGSFDRSSATITLNSTSEVELVRGDSTDSFDVGIQVIEFVQNFSEIINDNVNVTDTTVLSFTKVLIDNANVTDTTVLSFTKVLNDNSNVTDSITVTLTQNFFEIISNATNNVNVTDSVVLAINKTLLDNVNATDTVNAVISAQAFNQTISNATNFVNVTDSVTVGLAVTETIDGTLNNVTATDSILLDVIKGLPAGTAPAIFFNSSIPNVLNFTDFFTEVSSSGMIGEDITLDNQRPTKVIIANVSGTSTNGTLTMKVFTNVTLDVSTLGDAVLRATSDSYDLSTFDISTNKTLTFNFTSAPFITGSAFGLEMAGMNGTINLPIDQNNAGGKCFEVKDLVPIANFSKGPKDTLCEQFSFEVYVSNSTADAVNVTDNVVVIRMANQAVNDTSTTTDAHILNTTKVLNDTGGGFTATSACTSGIGSAFLSGCYTFDSADISNDTATNSGTLGTAADAEYFSNSVKSPFVINATGKIAQAVIQNGTSSLDTQGEIRLGSNSTKSQWNFLTQANTGSNLTSINFWLLGDVIGDPQYPLLDNMIPNTVLTSAGNSTANLFSLHTIAGQLCLIIKESNTNPSRIVNNECTTTLTVPDDGQYHMITLLMDKGNTTNMAKACVDGSSNCDTGLGVMINNFTGVTVNGGNGSNTLTYGSASEFEITVENTFHADDLAIWNGFQLSNEDIDTLFNTTGPGGVIVSDSIVTQLSQTLNQINNDNANVTDAHILNTTKVLNDTDTSGGGGGSGTAIANLVSNTYENLEQLDVLSIGGAGTFEGFVGNIYDDEQVPIYTNPVKITGIYANIGSVVNSGTMSMLIATNASVGSNPSDMVIVAVSDESIDLSNFPQVPGLPNAINDETNKPVLWNFTSQPTITFTNNTFIGFNFTDVVASIGANAIDIEGWSTGGFGNGQCYTANTTASETFANCIVPILGYEINVLVENVDDWQTTSGIEVGKLVVHHTFDDAQLYDSGENKALYRNAGTLQERADASALIETGTQGKADSSITGLLGEAFFMSEPIIGNDEGYMTVGFSDYDRIQDFNFINDNVTDTFSINVWVRGNWTTQSVDYIPIVSNLYTDSAFGFLLGMGSSGEATLDIVSNELPVIGSANTTGTVNDDDWGMLTLIVEKSNATSTVQLCLNSVCESKDRVNPYIEYGILSNKLIVADTNVNNFDQIVGRSPPIGIMIDELCIWEDYKLTSTDLSTLYNSGTGATCGTVTQTSGGGTTLGVGTVTASGSSTMEYQYLIGGGENQIPDGGDSYDARELGDDNVITGNLVNLTSIKITKFTWSGSFSGDGNQTVGNMTNATITGRIWSNATLGSSTFSDLVVEASTETLQIQDVIIPFADFPTIRDPRNPNYPLSFNFTTPVTLTGEFLLGFEFQDIHQNLTFVGLKAQKGGASPGSQLHEELNGVCVGNPTSPLFNFTDVVSECPDNIQNGVGFNPPEDFTFGVVAEKTVANLSVDTPIAPTKLRGYWTFDDNAVDDNIAMNAGTLGHTGDGSMMEMPTVRSSTITRNSTGLIGASYIHESCGGSGVGCIFNGTVIGGGNMMQIGTFTNPEHDDWGFLHKNAIKTSTSMWIRFNATETSLNSGELVFVSTDSSGIGDSAISYGLGLGGDVDLGAQINQNGTSFIDFAFDPIDTGGPGEFVFPGTSSSFPHFDGLWHHLAFIVDKTNSTFPMTICVDGTATVGGRCEAVPINDIPNPSQTDPQYTLMLGSIFEALNIDDNVEGFEMDEIAIWEDYLLSDSEIDQIATMAVVTAGNVTGTGAGVIVTDTVNAVLMQGLNQTNNDNANVTDAHILNTTKVLFDVNTTPSGGSEPSSKSVPYINTRDGGLGDGDLFFLSVDSGIIGHRSPNLLAGNITISSISGLFSGFDIQQAGNNGTIQGIILSNVTGTNNFEDRVIEGLSSNTVDLTTTDLSFFTTFTFNPPVEVDDQANLFFGFNYTGDGTNGIGIGVSDEMSDARAGNCVGVNQTVGVSWSSFDCSTVGPFSHNHLTIEVMMELDSPVPDFDLSGGISPTNLVTYIPFDNAFNATYDGSETVFSNTGTLGHNGSAIKLNLGGVTNNVITSTGIIGQAINLENTGYAPITSMENDNDFDFLSASTTDLWGISLWTKSSDFSSLGDFAAVLSNMGTEEYGIRIMVDSNQNVVVDIANSAGLILNSPLGINNLTSTTAVTQDWFHIGLTINKTDSVNTARLYINGTQEAVSAVDFSAGQTVIAEAPLLTIGESIAANSVWQTKTGENIEMQIDEVCIWKDYLPTASDMSTIFNSGSGSTCSTATLVSGGGNEGGVLTSDSINAFISSTANNQTVNDNVNVTDTTILNFTKLLDDNANVTDTVIISADFNQTVGTADNNVNVTDTVTIINSKNATIPSGTNTAIISDSVLLNFTKFLFGDQVDMTIANLTLVNATIPPGTPPPTGGPPTDAPETGAGSGGGGVPTVRSDPLSASLTGLTLTLSQPEHTLSSEIIVNPLFSSISQLGTIILNWDQQEPIQVTAVTVPPMFEEFIEFDIVQGQSLNFLGKKADPTDTFSTGIIDYEVTLPSLALGVSQETNPFGAAVTFFNFLQLVILNEYTIPVTVDAVHNGKPFQFNSEIVINHVKEVRWVVIAITIAGVAFLAVWGKGFFTSGTVKSGSFRKNLDKAKKATVDKQKRGSFRKELERQRSADRQNIKKLKKK